MAKKPAPKPKQLLPLLLVLLAAVIVLFGVIMTANRIASSESTSPNAPASQPKAYDPASRCKNIVCGTNQFCEDGKCISKRNPTPTIIRPTPTIIRPTPTKTNCTSAQRSECAYKNGTFKESDCTCIRPSSPTTIKKCSSPNSCSSTGCPPYGNAEGTCPTGQKCCAPEL